MRSALTEGVIFTAPKIATVLRVRYVCKIPVMSAVVQTLTAPLPKPVLTTFALTPVPVLLPVELILFVVSVFTRKYVLVKRSPLEMHTSNAFGSLLLVVHMTRVESGADVRAQSVELNVVPTLNASIMRNVLIVSVVLSAHLMRSALKASSVMVADV